MKQCQLKLLPFCKNCQTPLSIKPKYIMYLVWIERERERVQSGLCTADMRLLTIFGNVINRDLANSAHQLYQQCNNF